MSGEKCPSCGNTDSDEIIPYGDGYLCRDCGEEFGRNTLPKDK